MANTKIEPYFKVVRSVLLYRDYETREEVLKVAQAMARNARDNEKFTDAQAAIYLEAFEKIQELSFEQMMAIKTLVEPFPTEEEDEDEE